MFTMMKRPRPNAFAGITFGTLAVLLTVTLAYGAEKVIRSTSPGNPGTVVVDPAVQAIADKALAEAVKRMNASAGFAIVADPMTGKVLAISNVGSKKKGYWSIAETLEPASFMKTFVAATAIEKGLTTPDGSHACENGKYAFGGVTYHDWKKGGWEKLSTTETVAMSSDICSIKMGESLGAEGLSQMLTSFGFGPKGSAESYAGAKSGVLPKEGAQFVPAVTSGFAFKASPLELLQAYGAIANGGMLMAPIAANESGSKEVRRVLSPESAKKTREILRQVVLSGTGKGRAESEIYSMAGKTATSYREDLTKWDLVKNEKRGNFAGFIGFAPVNAPKVEVYVGILDPHTDKSGAHGGEHAGPVFKVIAEEVLQHMGVSSDRS